MDKVAVVILNWNGRAFLEKFLPPLLKYTDSSIASVVIADNHSTDDSVLFLEQNYAQLKVIRLEKNYGFAEGYNRALQQIEAEYYLLLNSDIEVTCNWVEPLVIFLDEHKDFAACSPALLNYQEKGFYEYAGAAGGYIDKFGYTFCRGRIFDHVEKENGLYKQPMEVFWTTGACMLIRSSTYHEADGFDGHFFAHMEEIDLCWRLKNSGWRLAVVPASNVYHVGGGTLPKRNPFKTFLNFRNNLYLLYKNLPEGAVNRMIRKRLFLDGISAMLFFFTLRWKDLRALVKAHREFLSTRQRYDAWRREETSNEKGASHKEIYSKSVVWDYFISQRKTFDKLRDQFPEKMDYALD